MLRIANPGSDIDQFIRIFRDLYVILKDRESFDLDDMTHAMIEKGNVSSQGATGDEALRRSTRKDRSRDPLFNQSKMYAELYRTLGWLQSTSSSLRFAFSWLGAHAAETPQPKPLAVECLLGMAYPNDVLGAQSVEALRVFPAILATANALGGGITRDEMIVGPLSLYDDRNSDEVLAMHDMLRNCRKKKYGIVDAIAEVSTRRGISPVTMGNYTRFPIAALQWAGWATKTSRSTLTLTPAGVALIKRLETLRDVRLADYKSLSIATKAPFLRLSAHLMLERAGFDLSPARESMDADRRQLTAQGVTTYPDLWFSPFQQLTRVETNAAFGHHTAAPKAPEVGRPTNYQEDHGRTTERARVRFVPTGVAVVVDTETVLLERELRSDLTTSAGLLSGAIETFAERHARDNQDVFYPLVATLFRLIGFECRISRRGVNYDRADAMIVDATDSIPIEIKSPGEEMEISVKALRQAVENKVILLSRKQFVTRKETTTLVVGFNAPNSRSEARELIGDIYKAYGFNVGVLDLRALAALAIKAILSQSRLNLDGFIEMKGVANVEDILAT
jgi:hypothetical protein